MRQLVPFQLSSGARVLVEVDDERGVVRAGSRPAEALTEVASSITEALTEVRDAADDAIHTLSAMASDPSRIELAFGVKLTAEANAVIAKAGAEAQFTVTVVWERDLGEAH